MALINWWQKAIQGRITPAELKQQNKNHYPPLCSVTFTRQCVLNCKHCVYPEANQADIALNNLKRIDKIIQACYDVGVRELIHVGRILKKEHLPILKKYYNKGMTIDLIDNGSARRLLPEIKKIGLFFNGGIDISIDGDRPAHEAQRGAGSYKMALAGARALRSAADHISITGTASSLNYDSIAAGFVKLKKELPFVKVFQITTTSPVRHHKQRMNLTGREMRKLWQEVLKVSRLMPITLGIYRTEDFGYIASALAKYGRPKLKNISLEWQIGNLTVKFFPSSIVAAEEFAIDANGVHYLPFGGDHHLADRPEAWQASDNLILKDPDRSYEKIVEKYWQRLGQKDFQKEKEIFEKCF